MSYRYISKDSDMVYSRINKGVKMSMLRGRIWHRAAAVGMAAALKCGVAMSALGLSLTVAHAADTQASNTIETVVVTARKRVEDLQKVPISATVFGGAALERSDIKQIRDLQYSIPNVSFSDVNDITNPFVSIRGIYANTFQPGISSPLTMYVDGVLTGRTASFGEDLGDTERVEVLRGPQGTLFGRNTTGGAINIVTKQPSTDGFTFDGTTEVGNYNLFRVSGAVNVPLSDDAALRVYGFRNYRGDFTTNAVGPGFDNLNNFGGRAQFSYQPTDDLKVTLEGDYQKDDAHGPVSQNLFDPWAQALTLLGIPTSNGTFTDFRKFHANEDGNHFQRRTLSGLSATVQYTLANEWQLTSISAFRHEQHGYLTDEDTIDSNHLAAVTDAAFGVPLTWSVGEFLGEKHNQYTEELRIASPAGRSVNFVGGIYILNETTDFSGLEVFNDTSFLVFLATGSPTNAQGAAGPFARQNLHSYAAFGNVDWNITPAATLTVGLRDTIEHSNAVYGQTADPFVPVFGFNLIPPIAPIPLKRSDSALSPTVSFQYQFNDDQMGYVKVARGFKAGGYDFSFRTFVDPFFTLPLADRPKALSFNPEFVTTYEAGWKGQSFENRLRTDVSAFYSDYTDQQVRDVTVIGGVPVSTFVNAGKSRIWGFEGEAVALPWDGVEVTAGVGYLNSKILTDTPPGAKDQSLPYAPEWTLNGSIQKSFNLGAGIDGYARVEASFKSSETQTPGDAFPLPSLMLVNATLGTTFDDGRYEARAWVKNIFNADEILQRSNATDAIFGILGIPVNSFFVAHGTPRTIGIELAVHL